MKAIEWLLLFSLISRSESCLVVFYACRCAVIPPMDISQTVSYISNFEGYDEIKHYEMRAPQIKSYDCHTQLRCEGLTLVVFANGKSYKFSGDRGDSACRQPITWQLYDNGPTPAFDTLIYYPICVNFTPSCICPDSSVVAINQDNKELVPSYRQNDLVLDAYLLQYPNISNGCEIDIHCDDPSYSLRITDGAGQLNYFYGSSAHGICNQGEWHITSLNDSQKSVTAPVVYAVCAGDLLPCPCTPGFLDKSNISSYVSEYSGYSEIKDLPINWPVIVDRTCRFSVYCALNSTVVMFYNGMTHFHKEGFALCNRVNGTWSLQDTADEEMEYENAPDFYATCVDLHPPKCDCTVFGLDETNVKLVFDSPLYKNVSSYPLKLPKIINDCSGSISCDEGYSLIVSDTIFISNFGAYSADGLCNPADHKWQIVERNGEIRKYDRVYATCVLYEASCTCSDSSIIAINQNNKELVPGYLQNDQILDGYLLQYPNISNGCEIDIHCDDPSYSLMMYDDAGKRNNFYEQTSANGICDQGEWNITSLKDSRVLVTSPVVYAVCVGVLLPCTCTCGSLDKSNLSSYVSEYSGYSTIKDLPINEAVIINNGCKNLVGCADKYTVVMFYNGNTHIYEGAGHAICNRVNQSWSLQDGAKTEIEPDSASFFYATCVDMRPPKCDCTVLGLDESNVKLVFDSPLYRNVSGYPLKLPKITIDECSGSISCDEGYSLIVSDTNFISDFGAYSADGLCNPTEHKWHIVERNGEIRKYDRLYATCV